MAADVAEQTETKEGFIRGLGLLDSTMIVAGSMIGSGIFIVSADIARQTGSAGGLLLTWIITGILTIFAALSYGELAAMMPKAGGQYVYLARKLFAVVGISLRLDFVFSHSNGNDCGGRGGFCEIFGNFSSFDFADFVDYSADQFNFQLRRFIIRSASRRRRADSFSDDFEYAGFEARQNYSESFHVGENIVFIDFNRFRNFYRRRGGNFFNEFFEFIYAAERRDYQT